MLPRAGDNGDPLQKSAKEELVSSGRVSGGFGVDSFNTAGSPDGGWGGGREQKIFPTVQLTKVGKDLVTAWKNPTMGGGSQRDLTPLDSKMSLHFLPAARVSRSTGSCASRGSPYDLSRFAARANSPRRTMCFPCHLLQGGDHVSMFSVLPTEKIILKKAFSLDEQNYYSLYLLVPSPSPIKSRFRVSKPQFTHRQSNNNNNHKTRPRRNALNS